MQGACNSSILIKCCSLSISILLQLMLKALKRTFSFIRNHPIGSKTTSLCFCRWVCWQLRSRIFGGPHIIDWIEGSKLVIEPGMTGATGNLYCGLHEFSNMGLLLHYFGSEGGVFVDMGANVGTYSILASRIGKADSLAFEPVHNTYNRLLSNLKVNGLSNKVIAREMVLGEQMGSIRFSTDRDAMNQVVDSTYSGESKEIDVTTIDAALDGVPTHFWKMDVEGYEVKVLRGAKKSLEMPELQVILTEGSESLINDILKEAGFRTIYYDAFRRKFIEVPPYPEIHRNRLWVRDIDQVSARCKKSPTVRVLGLEI